MKIGNMFVIMGMLLFVQNAFGYCGGLLCEYVNDTLYCRSSDSEETCTGGCACCPEGNEVFQRQDGSYDCCSYGWVNLEKEDGEVVCCQKYNPEISNVDGDMTKNTETPQLTSEGKCCFGTVSTHSYWDYKCENYGCGQHCGEFFPETYVENREVCCPYGTTATLLTGWMNSPACPEEVVSYASVGCCANGTETKTYCGNPNEDGTCYSDYHEWTECK